MAGMAGYRSFTLRFSGPARRQNPIEKRGKIRKYYFRHSLPPFAAAAGDDDTPRRQFLQPLSIKIKFALNIWQKLPIK